MWFYFFISVSLEAEVLGYATAEISFDDIGTGISIDSFLLTLCQELLGQRRA